MIFNFYEVPVGDGLTADVEAEISAYAEGLGQDPWEIDSLFITVLDDDGEEVTPADEKALVKIVKDYIYEKSADIEFELGRD
jgi:hypothetical protein